MVEPLGVNFTIANIFIWGLDFCQVYIQLRLRVVGCSLFRGSNVLKSTVYYSDCWDYEKYRLYTEV